MFDKLKPYPSYKDSGVEWLGDVPEHWETKRIKTIFREKDRTNGNGSEILLSLTRNKGILPQSEASNRIASVEDLSKYKLCNPGDLVMNRMQAWSGMFAVSPIEGLISPDYSIFKPIDKVDVKYFEALFKTPILITQFAIRSKGIGSGFNRLYTPDFGDVAISIPPLSEQAAIVRFLDYIDKRIRKSINSKKKLIKLLEEEKQAIINQAVTRGLDPNVRMKPSGVEWLGDVPEHWEIRRLKTVMNVIMGQSPPSQDCSDDPIGIPFLQGCADFGKKYPNPTQFCLFPNKKSPENAILLSVRAPVGKMNFSNQIYGIGRGLCALKVNSKKMEIQYAYYLLEACKEGLTLVSTGSTYDAVSIGDIGDQPFLLPPFFEQTEIIKFLKKETSDIDKAMDKEISEIALLTEYHTRLISDVVTGKLDVRDAAARLPEEIEEPDDIEEIELEGDTGDYDLIEGEVDPNLEQNEN